MMGLPQQFNYYLAMCDNDPVKLAEQLSADFFEIWWNSPLYEQSRTDFGDQAVGSKQLPFKYELVKLVKRLSTPNPAYKVETELLSKSLVDGIITTNWDDFLETTFKEFKLYVGQSELMFADSLSIGDIYKIHGCATLPQSLVVTEKDYDTFHSRNPYLAAKLLTVFVEHPIIFIGYSLSDTNIIEIIDSIVQCLDTTNIGKLKDRLIFVEWVPGQNEPVLLDGNIVLKDKKVLPIKHIKLENFNELYEVLGSLKKRLPLKVLRKIKESMYELIKTNQPTKNIYIGNLEDVDDDSPVQFVVGVGVAATMLSAQGYTGVEAKDVIEDVIFDHKTYDPGLLVEKVFPRLAKATTSYIPYCKYFGQLGYFNKNGTLNAAGQAAVNKFGLNYRTNMPDCFTAKGYQKDAAIVRQMKGLDTLLKRYDIEHAIKFIPFMERKDVDLIVLQNFLAEVYSKYPKYIDTFFRKLVCLYDFYKYN